MARYREYSYDQSLMVPISLAAQLQPGTFEYTINYLVDHEIDLSVFEDRYHNDETGAPAYDPAVLLKVILFAYSRGITSSRRIAQAFEENVVFMALSADTHPHFTTIADFIGQMDREIASVFTDVLSVCYTEGLIGKTMFAVDGCKISSNCFKEWSGTKAELQKKAKKIEESIERLLARHRETDQSEPDSPPENDTLKAVERLQAKAAKVREFLQSNGERVGRQGKAVKSNVTDNESAKMPSSHGIIQGYNGIATVDERHQVIVDAQAFGEGHEAQHVPEVLDSVERQFKLLDDELNIYDEIVLTADTGFNSEASAKTVLDRNIDAYFADPQFRKRDPRFANQQEHRAKSVDRWGTTRTRKYFAAADFHFDESGTLICPNGTSMRRSSTPYVYSGKGYTGWEYYGYGEHCGPCALRSKCIRAKKRQIRRIKILDSAPTAMQRMIERFDSERGRRFYSKRMGTVEPVFGNIRYNLGLDRFSFRGKTKVDTQWKLFCLVHNIGKLACHASLRPRGAACPG